MKEQTLKIWKLKYTKECVKGALLNAELLLSIGAAIVISFVIIKGLV